VCLTATLIPQGLSGAHVHVRAPHRTSIALARILSCVCGFVVHHPP